MHMTNIKSALLLTTHLVRAGMAKTLCKRSPLTAKQLSFLKIHVLRERKKADEAYRTKPATASTAENVQLSNKSMELNSKSIETDDSQKTSEDLGGQQSLSPTTPPASAEMLSSPDHADFLKSTEKNKEYEPETPEDIAKQVKVLNDHLESLKAEKHRLFQQLKTVLHEEDEKQRIKDMEQKQEEKCLAVGDFVLPLDPRFGEFALPMDPRLIQSSGVPFQLGLPTSPTSGRGGGGGGPGLTLKKQPQRVPLLPTPEGGPMLYMRQGQGSSSTPFHHSTTDSFQASSHLPFNAHHHAPGGTPAGVQRGGPYQDQRVGGHNHSLPQDVQGVHGSLPGMTAPAPGITCMQQPQYQGVPGVPVGGTYQYSTAASYGNGRNAATTQPTPTPYQQSQPPPPQQVISHSQGYQGIPPHDIHMTHMMQTQFQPQAASSLPHFIAQGAAGGQMVGGPSSQIVGGAGAQMVGGAGAQMVGGAGAQMVGGAGAQMVGGAGAQMVGGVGAQMVGGAGGQMVAGAGCQMVSCAGGQIVGAVQLYSSSASLPTPEQPLNIVPQSYSVHSKGMQDPRQHKMLEQQQQQQQRVGPVLNPAYIKQVQQESHHQGSPSS